MNPKHLLRAILRECTYLPDAEARKYMHKWTLRKFRNFFPKTVPLRKYDPNEGEPDLSHRLLMLEDRQYAAYQRGERRLQLLRRANEGYLKPLEDVLMRTYGRTARERNYMMDKVDHPDTPETHRDVEKLFNVERYSINWQPSSLFEQLMTTQVQNLSHLDRSVRGKLRFRCRSDVVPKINSWGLPMPRCRVRNLTRKWYDRTSSQLLTPRTAADLARLRRLALDPPAESELPKRRNKVGVWDDDECKTLSSDFLLKGPAKPGISFHKEYRLHGRPHRITRRVLSSMYAKIYNHTPQIHWNEDIAKYELCWSQISPRKRQAATITSEEQGDLLFRTSKREPSLY